MSTRLLMARCCCSCSAAGPAPPTRRRQERRNQDGDFCWRLLLVHRGGFREAAGSAWRRVRLYRRPTVNPTYEQVSAGNTGHTEAIRVSYDPQRSAIRNCSTTSGGTSIRRSRNRQFCDIGTQYRSGIYWQNEAERKAAESSRDALLASGKVPRIETEIVAASTFYPAEEYHQDYYKKNPIRYAYYRRVAAATRGEADLGGLG
jgi:methionine-S-sulfoxide reductase